MALPKKPHQPDHPITLYSLDKKQVKYRPYSTGEEKLLLMVRQSDDPQFVADTIKKVLGNCILDPSVNVDHLASYDIENLLIKIHAKSVGESLDLKYKDSEDGKTYKLTVDLDKLDVVFDPEHVYTIKITDDVGLRMKDLTFDKLMGYQRFVNDIDDPVKRVELSFETMIDCIDALYDEEQVYKIGEETTREELVGFINDIAGITKELMNFLSTMPAVKYETELPNGKKVVIKDIKSFLA